MAKQKLSNDECEHLPNNLRAENSGCLTIGDSSNKVKQIDVVTANIDTGNVTTLGATTLVSAGSILGGVTILTGVTSITAHYTVGSYTAILCNATGGAITLTLPASSLKRLLSVKKVALDSSTNAVTITPASGTIDNAATNAGVDAAGDKMMILSDGTNWHIIAQKLA